MVEACLGDVLETPTRSMRPNLPVDQIKFLIWRFFCDILSMKERERNYCDVTLL